MGNNSNSQRTSDANGASKGWRIRIKSKKVSCTASAWPVLWEQMWRLFACMVLVLHVTSQMTY